jgi:hypothetical protein
VVGVLIVAMSTVRIGEVRKNEAYHALFAQVTTVTGRGATLAIDLALYDDWMLDAVAQWYDRITLMPGKGSARWRLVLVGGEIAEAGPAVRSGSWELHRIGRAGPSSRRLPARGGSAFNNPRCQVLSAPGWR